MFCRIWSDYARPVQDPVVTELDRQVVNALQINPRASWAQIGSVLGADPVTVARRWQRLRDQRLAWVTAYRGTSSSRFAGALVEVECMGSTLALTDQLIDDPECMTVDITSGGRDLLLTVGAAGPEALSQYLLSRLGVMDSVRAVRTHVVTDVFSEASSWRLRELTESQVDRLGGKPARQARQATQFASRDESDVAVLAALTQDGRMPSSEIAERAGVSVRKAREIVDRLIGTGQVILRTEMARRLSGWPVYAWYFLRVPPATLAKAIPRLNRLQETRTIMITAGPHNVMMAVWMRELADVAKLEAAIEEQINGVQIGDRSIVLRTVKLVGAVLDSDGRRIRSVPASPPDPT